MVSYTNHKDQDFKVIKDDCIKNKCLFEDPEFPAVDSSLFYSKKAPSNVVWKRPKEIDENATFFVDGASTADVSQGNLGNCWFVAAAASLSQRPKILENVIPDNKTATISSDINEKYQGIFRFHFWRFSDWVEVVIDDRLPTIDDDLIYTKSKERHEFWSALLEKAYAKLAESYEALSGGNAADALVDFTGGVSESVNLVKKDYANDFEKRKVLHKRLRKLLLKDTLCSASIKIASNDEMEKQLETGLIKGHAYTINTVKTITIGESFFSRFKSGNLHLVKLRNPWGIREWNGPWSDNSKEWKQLSHEEKTELDVKVEDDGEFWMSWDDFCSHFTTVTICALVNTSFFSIDKTYNEGSFKGKWKGRGAGGCINNKSSFFHNPQYMFDMTGKKRDEVFISLMQPDTRINKADGEKGNLTIGFYVMKVEANRTHRVNYFYDKAGDSTFINSREVFERLELDPGRYVIIPSTFHPKTDGEFLLRIYTDEANNMEELVLNKPKARRSACLPLWRSSITQMSVIITEVSNLVKKGNFSSTVDPYCIIECEGTKITTPTITDNFNPKFDYGGIFYVKNPSEATLNIQVWDNNTLVPDTYLGGIATSVRPNNKLTLHTVQLMEKITKDGKGNIEADGKVSFKLAISNNVGFM